MLNVIVKESNMCCGRVCYCDQNGFFLYIYIVDIAI